MEKMYLYDQMEDIIQEQIKDMTELDPIFTKLRNGC
jgi:hypothetical protein